MYNAGMESREEIKKEKIPFPEDHLLDDGEADKMDRELDAIIQSRRKRTKNPLAVAAFVILAAVFAVGGISYAVMDENVIVNDTEGYDYDWYTVNGSSELTIGEGVSFTLEGTEYRLPVDLQQFLDAGWEVDRNEYSSLPDLIYEDDWISVDLRKGPLDLYSVRLDVPAGLDSCRGEEAQIVSLTVEETEDIDFQDCFGISTASDPEDVKEELDSHDLSYDVYRSGTYESYSLTADGGDETGSLSYNIYEGKISSISLSYYSYD